MEDMGAAWAWGHCWLGDQCEGDSPGPSPGRGSGKPPQGTGIMCGVCVRASSGPRKALVGAGPTALRDNCAGTQR